MKKERKRVLVSYGFVTVMLLAAMLGGPYGGGVFRTNQSQYYPLPTVLAVSPADENITTDETVITVFSTEMDKQSAQNAFNITPYASGTFSWVDNYTMKFTPNEDLSNSTTYTITIDADTAKSPNNEYLDGNGNNVSEGSPTDDVVWDFATDDTSPEGGSLPSDQYPWLQFHKDRERTGDYHQDAKYVNGEYSYDSKKRVDSSPIVESGFVLYGDNDGVVWAIEETTMKKEWKRKMGNTPAKPTMVADDTYFWVATEGSSSQDPKLQKRQLKNGNQPPPSSGERGVKVKFENGRIYAPLTFVEGHIILPEDRIYVLVDYPNVNPGTSVVFAFDRNNNYKWKYQLPDGRNTKTAGICVPTPGLYAGNYRLFFGDTQGFIYSLSERYDENGEVDIYRIVDPQNPGAGVYSTPTSIYPDYVYVALADRIYEVNAYASLYAEPFEPTRTSPRLAGDIVASLASHERHLFAVAHNENELNPWIYFIRISTNPAESELKIERTRSYQTGWDETTIGEKFCPSPAISSSTVFFLVPKDTTGDHGVYYEFTNDQYFTHQNTKSLPSGTFFTSSSVGLHYWDSHGRIFMGTDGNTKGIYQLTDET